MAKRDDSAKNYNRDMDLLFQQIEDRKDKILFARLKAVGKKVDDDEIWAFIMAARAFGVSKGMSIPAAHASGDELITFVLDHDMLDDELNVKD